MRKISRFFVLVSLFVLVIPAMAQDTTIDTTGEVLTEVTTFFGGFPIIEAAFVAILIIAGTMYLAKRLLRTGKAAG